MEGTIWLHLKAIIIILTLFSNLAAGFDTITSTEALTQNQTIVSSDKLFELGFFSPGNSSKWYIGIWYKKVPVQAIVWVANRDDPLSSSSGTLKIDKNGNNWVLSDESGKAIWQTNGTSLSGNTVAQILDTGNFVVRKEDDVYPGNYLWQSFDHLTDTLLPLKNVKFPGSSNVMFNESMNSAKCKRTLFQNCSCTAYAESGGSGSMIWMGDRQSLEATDGEEVPKRVSNKVPGSSTPARPIIVHMKRFFEIWDLRIVILVSLLLQILLIFLAPFRKRVSSPFLSTPMWLAYLLADITATYALGIISKSQTHDPVGPFVDHNLPAFWAPFLLVHLGGPDTITAFAIEDNELWLRHAASLLFHGFAIFYSFIQSFPNKTLLVPTLLMIFAGLLKYTERTRSLFLASSRRFRNSLLAKPDPGPNYARLIDEYTPRIDAMLPTKIKMIIMPERAKTPSISSRPLSDLDILKASYDFFNTFRGLMADLIFTFRERTYTRNFFLQRNARDAFKVVELELNFFYEILHTKVLVVYNIWGYIFRLVYLGLTCSSLVLFVWFNKHNIERFDIATTYIHYKKRDIL